MESLQEVPGVLVEWLDLELSARDEGDTIFTKRLLSCLLFKRVGQKIICFAYGAFDGSLKSSMSSRGIPSDHPTLTR